MIKILKYFILQSLIFLLFQSGTFGQASANTIVKLNRNTLFFINGDSLPLVSLIKQDYQLVVLVFHAEEDTIGLDPGLSVNGRWRAIHLNKLFKEVDYKGYYTTPFRNNILTLQPLMDTKASKVNYYDQADLKTLTENIKKLFPAPVIVVVHPETVGIVFEQLTQQKFPITLNGNLSEKMILIQRGKTVPSIWNECKYSIR